MKNLSISPQYCQYTSGSSDQLFENGEKDSVFFLYPSDPKIIAQQVEAANGKLQRQQGKIISSSWNEMDVPGQIIFCEICKKIRSSTLIVADITTLNFNLLYEIGFCIGLGQAVLPIRDSNYAVDKKDFDDLGLLDTLGYFKYSNSQEIVNEIVATFPRKSLPEFPEKIFLEAPLYFVKGSVDSDGAVKYMATLKKSALTFRTYDPIETPRLSLYEARKQVGGSFGVFAHLFSPNRKNSKSHNSLCAFICGMAMAQQKVVFMLQEEFATQPIDYRDIVISYDDPNNINRLLQRPIYAVVQNMQRKSVIKERDPELLLEQIDLGDTAAENEIRGLENYYVRTGQFNQAKQGHANLIVGRKGSGKTATFYEVRNSIGHSKYKLIVDLKPEGHQFIKLKEYVLSKMSEGIKEHTVVAFWNYILLTEISLKIIEKEYSFAERDPDRFDKFNKIKEMYGKENIDFQSDFSQRLLIKVDSILKNVSSFDKIDLKANVTQLIYEGDINKLNQVLCDYLSEKSEVWILFDNIDKGWPTRGASKEDILIVRGLLTATRKLQRQLEFHDVSVKCLVFIRTDIYELLLQDSPDKGKDSMIQLDWDDEELFKQIVLKRIQTSTNLDGNFRQIWPQIFESHINAQDSFSYILERTLMRPRDLLTFLQKAVQIALNRGNTSVTSGDILQAEKSYSEDMFLMTSFEIEDTYPQYKDILYCFHSCTKIINNEKLEKILITAGISKTDISRVVDLLLWFGFLGVWRIDTNEEKYSYSVSYSLRHLLIPIESGDANFVIHPSFRSALEITD